MKLIDLKDELRLTTAQAQGKEAIPGSLYLENTQITSLPDNLTVGGYLNLENTQITSLPDNLTVGTSLYLRGTQITSLRDNLTVGASLDLENTQITSLPDNLTVGGYLDLRGTQITSLPDNLTVGGYLDLENTQITSLPDNLTVGGSLYLRGTQIKNKAAAKKKVKPTPPQWKLSIGLKLSWQNGKYRVFDGIFCEVIRQLKNVFKVKAGSKIQYVVTDGENFSHGDTIKQAKADLIYKISNRDTSAYKDLTLDSVVTKAQAIQMYRVITGACEAGTKHFVSGLAKTKAKYKIAELIKLTKGHYGAQTFAEFFGMTAND